MLSRHLSLPLAALMLASVPMAAMAQAPGGEERSTLTIVGAGQATAAPDIALTTLTVLRSAATAQEATQESSAAVTAVTQAMRDLGIEGRDLQTSGFSISPQYQYDNNQNGQPTRPPEIVGYEVRNSLTVRVRDIAKVGAVLDKAISLGVNQGGDITFTIENPAPLADAARRDAIAKARASAQVMADAADLELGDIVSLVDETNTVAPPRPMMAGAMMRVAAEDASVPVEAGENTVSAQVRVTFEIVPAAQ
ncbi:SIMPL domain-containing protein [Aureimonas frigidaquae]|uniref:SIMPL domain-containing protein n=1 Tax=Aureimonas frigidaquae TaxID=424757 RepID=UPI00078099A1|nr:SIMPL domain-containing protein [Aureimonas frigidaquae]